MKTAKVTGLDWILIDGKLVRLDLRTITGYTAAFSGAEGLGSEHLAQDLVVLSRSFLLKAQSTAGPRLPLQSGKLAAGRKLLSRLLFGFRFGWRNDLQFQVLQQRLLALIFK